MGPLLAILILGVQVVISRYVKNFARLPVMMCVAISLLFLGMEPCQSAKKPEIVCAQQILMVNPHINKLLEVGDTKQRVLNALVSKIRAEEQAGKLPCTIKWTGDYEVEGLYSELDQDMPVAIVPVAIMSDSLDSSHKATDNKIFYKSVVVGSLYLLVCRGDGNANELTMLGAIPVSGYDGVTLGGGLNTLRNNPPTLAEKANVYATIMERRIQDALNLGDLNKYIKNINKPADDTYEVVAVDMTAKRTEEIFGTHKEDVKAMLGSLYSARFEETSKKIVYPPITMIAKAGTGDRSNAGNESVADSINDSIFSLTGGISGSGAGMKVSMPQPNHKIRLNFSGAAWQELKGKKESSVVKNIGYKAWLRSQMDGGAERVVDDVKSVQYTIPASGSITEDEKDRLPDIYTELLIRLSDKLASGKK